MKMAGKTLVEGINPERFTSLLSGVEALDRAHGGAAERFRIMVLRNCTVDQLLPYLKYETYSIGIIPEVLQGDFDGYALELRAWPSEVLPHLVLVVLHGESFLVCNATGVVDGKASEERLDVLLDLIARCQQPVVLNTLAVPSSFAAQGGAQAVHVTWRLNERLAAFCSQYHHCRLVNLAGLVCRLGEHAAFDRRYWYRFKAPFRPALLRLYAAEVGAIIRDLRGLAKKCLVLDCDNTLWGGILGEVGPAGIDLHPHDYPGNVYYEFQRQILRLQQNGVMIALLSKNNEAEVLEVLDKHPYCLLSRDHLVGHRINWDDKPGNLRSLVRALNIGLEHVVYIDDSEMECALMRHALPEVMTVHVPKDRSALPDLLTDATHFSTRPMTDEDRERTRMYREAVIRESARDQYESLDDFLASLDMTVDISRAYQEQVPRVSQLLARTNQFSLTKLRPSEADAAKMLADNRHYVYTLKARDRFGDLGLVGVIVLAYNNQGALVMEAFAMSCRALGRRLEDALFLRSVEDAARRTGATMLEGRYEPTPKNGQVANLLDRFGLRRTAQENKGSVCYTGDLAEIRIVFPAFLKVVESGKET